MANSLRVKALEAVSWLVSMKKKAIMKMNLMQPILDVVFSLMCKCDDDDEESEDSEETEKAASYAARVSYYRVHISPVSHAVRMIVLEMGALL